MPWEPSSRPAATRAAAKPDTNGPDLRAGFDPVPLKEASVPLTQPCATGSRRAARPPTPPILNATTVESPWTSLGSESDEPGPPSPQFSERPPVADQQTQELGLSPMSRHLDELSDSDSTPITASQCNPTPAAAAATKIDVPGQDVDTSAQPASHLEQIEAGPAENQIADGLPETTDQIAIAPNTFTNHESSFEEPVQPALRQTKAARQALPSRKRTFQEPHQAEPDGAKRAVNRSRKNAEGKRAAVAEAKTDGRPARPLTANASGPDSASKSPQVPSAKDILATHETRRTTPRTGPPTVRPRAAFAPTLAREPDQLALPAWVAGPPAVAFVVVVGLASGILSWRWTNDSYNAAVMMDRLLAADQTGRAERFRNQSRRLAALGLVPPRKTWRTGRSS